MTSAKALGYRLVYIQGWVRKSVRPEQSERRGSSKKEGQRVSWASGAYLRTSNLF